MKRCILLLLPLLLLAGCSGVRMNGEYSRLLDETAAVSLEYANRAESGTIPPEGMRAALKWNAAVWARFQDARDGVGR